MTGCSTIETNYSGNYKNMDMKKTKVALVTASLLALLSGCNDNSSDPSGVKPVPPTPPTPEVTDGPVARLPKMDPPQELLVAGDNQVVIALVDTQSAAKPKGPKRPLTATACIFGTKMPATLPLTAA